jgi:hypothetical protein
MHLNGFHAPENERVQIEVKSVPSNFLETHLKAACTVPAMAARSDSLR